MSLYSFANDPASGSFPANGVVVLPNNGGYVLPLAGVGGSPYGNAGSIGVVAGLYPQMDGTLQEFILGTFAPEGAAPNVPLINKPSAGPYTFVGATWFGGACGWGGLYEVTAPADPNGTVIFENLYNDFSVSNGKYYIGNPTPSGGNPDVCSDPAASNYGSLPVAVLPLVDEDKLLVTTQYGGPYGYGTFSRFEPDNQGGYTQIFPDYTFPLHGGGYGGYLPFGPLLQTAANTVYGMTLEGNQNFPAGTLYRATRSKDDTWSVTPAYIFPDEYGGSPNGAIPIGLSKGPDNKVYGATFTGGSHAGGTIWRYDPETDTFEKLLDMGNAPQDLSFPLTAPLAVADQDAKLHIFFTGSNGGDINTNNGYGSGGVGAITEPGISLTVWSFTNGPDGVYPSGPIAFNPENYTVAITMPGGGIYGYGAITQIQLPLDSSTVFQWSEHRRMSPRSAEGPSHERPHYSQGVGLLHP